MKRLPVAVLIAALAASSACGKKKVPKGKVTAEAAALIAHLPADARMLMGANLAAARETDIYKSVIAKLVPELPPELQMFKEACNIDVLNDIDQVVVSAGEDFEDEKQMYFAVKGKVTKSALSECISKISTERQTGVTVAEEGKLTVYSAPAGKAYVYWPTDDTVVASWAGVDNAEAMQKAVAGGAQNNETLMSFAGKVNTGALVWMAGETPASLRAQTAAMPGELEGLFFQAEAPSSDTLKVLFGMRLTKDADKAADQIEDQIDSFKSAIPDKKLGSLLGRVEVMQSGSDVALGLKLSKEDITHLMGMGALMGGGGFGGF